MPVAAVPANLLAEPVAGLVMMWGCSAGLVAGLVGGPVAEVVHLPTALGLAWVSGVARWAADLPLGHLGAGGVAAVGAALAVVVAARRRGRPRATLVASAVVAVVLVVPATRTSDPAPVGLTEVAGAELWVGAEAGGGGATVLVVDGATSVAPLLAGLRQLGVGHLDLLATRSGGGAAASTVAAVRQQLDVGALVSATEPRLELAVTGPG
jgi:hypothetical protein